MLLCAAPNSGPPLTIHPIAPRAVIVGAVVLAVYIVMCGFHRQLLAPPKAAQIV